jgi:separase
MDLAHEYLKLGKTHIANATYRETLNAVRNGDTSDAVAAMFFLRYAEALALADNINER